MRAFFAIQYGVTTEASEQLHDCFLEDHNIELYDHRGYICVTCYENSSSKTRELEDFRAHQDSPPPRLDEQVLRPKKTASQPRQFLRQA